MTALLPRRLVRPVGLSTMGTVLFRMSGALGGLLAARLLGPEGRGEYALLILAGTIAGTLGTGGLQFWVARCTATGETADVRGVLKTHFGRVAIGLVLLAGVVIATESLQPGAVIATALFAGAWVVSMLYLAMPNGRLHMGTVALATSASGVTFIAWMLLLSATHTRSVTLVVLGAAASNAVVVPIIGGLRRLPAGSPGGYRAALAACRGALVGELITLAMFRVDLALLAVFADRRTVGLYAVATAVTELLWLVPDGVAQVVLPVASGPSSNEEVRRLVLLGAAVTACGAVALSVIARPVIGLLFGREFGAAAAAVPALAFGAVAMGVWKMVGSDAVARGAGWMRAASSLTGLVTMLVADLALIPAFGIAGAAAGAAVGYTASAIQIGRWWVKNR